MPPDEPRFAGTPVPTPPIPDDDGAASTELTARLAEFAAGAAGGAVVLDALARSRVFVPVVAVLDEAEVGSDGLRHEKHSSMATVLVQGPGGGRALLGFSSIESLTRWRADARPVPVAAPLAARAAVDEGADTLLIDVAGPISFAVAGRELLLLAAMARHPAGPSEDPVLREALKRHLTGVTQIKGASLVAEVGRGSASAEPRDGTPGSTGVLTLVVVDDDRSWLGGFTNQVADDQVIARLLPGGLRVRVVTER